MTKDDRITCAAHAFSLLPDIDLVLEHARSDSACVALARRPSTGKYAVCILDFRRRVVSAPLRSDHVAGARVAAILGEEGLRRVLEWTDQDSALQRFRALSAAVPQPRHRTPRQPYGARHDAPVRG